MWRRVYSIASWLRAAGVERASEQGIGKQVSLTNDLSLIAGTLYVGGLISDLLMPSSWMVMLDIVVLNAHFGLPFLNYAGFFRLSRMLLVLLTNLVIFLATAAEGPESGMQYFFPTFVGLPLVLFDLRERVLLSLGVALPVACFVTLEAGGYQNLLPAWMLLPTSRTIFWDSVLSAFAFSFLTVLYFFSANRKAERRLREQQEQIVASSKLSALGEMASGVAHEINNPLGILLLLASRLVHLVKAEPLDAVTVRKFMVDMEDNLQRIAAIVRGLMAFARDGSRDPFVPVLVTRVVEDALGLCRERFRHHQIELRVGPASSELVVQGRAVEIAQILVNLLNNAHDAVEQRGGSDKWIEVSILGRPGHVEIGVSDSGEGVPEELRSKIFQPFFTTKPIGKGTGLGLSVSLGLAQGHGGDLMLDSLSPFTRFVLSLPRVPEVHVQPSVGA